MCAPGQIYKFVNDVDDSRMPQRLVLRHHIIDPTFRGEDTGQGGFEAHCGTRSRAPPPRVSRNRKPRELVACFQGALPDIR